MPQGTDVAICVFQLCLETALFAIVCDLRSTIRDRLRSFAIIWKPTVAHNCHIKTKCSLQIQIAHIKFKSLTVNSNRSQQIQITHSKLQINHSKLQIAHSKFKSPTANSNRPQQIQIVHSKLKSLTVNYIPLGASAIYSQRYNSSKNICHT